MNEAEKKLIHEQIGKDGYEAPASLKNVPFTQTLTNDLFNKASKKYKKIGYKNIQEYITALIIKDIK